MTNLPSAGSAGTITIGGDRTVNRLGFGAMRITGDGVWGPPRDRAAAVQVLRRAAELGVDFVDTADSYGPEVSEELIAEAYGDRPAADRPLVATKGGFLRDGPNRWRPDGRPEHLRAACEGSLRRLGVERVDLYLIHAPDPDTPLAETLGAFDELVRAGKVGAIGASNVDRPYLEEALATSEREGLVRFEWVQNSYSLLDREPEEGVLAFCREHGLGFTPFGPLAGGWLTGKYRRGQPYPAGSRMTLRPEPYVGFDQERVYRGLERLADAAAERGVDTATLAFAWLFASRDVTAVVVGPRRPEHLEPARRALELELTPDERAEIAAFFGAA
jgi:pyridoxine 4-dehydrogenase